MEDGLLTACPVCSNVRLIEPVGLSCGHFTCWPCRALMNTELVEQILLFSVLILYVNMNMFILPS